MPTRPWRTRRLPPLAGAKEAAAILGIHKTTLLAWLQPGSGMQGADKTRMIPPVRIDSGPVWVKEDVERLRDGLAREDGFAV
jgi:hypothetical protein